MKVLIDIDSDKQSVLLKFLNSLEFINSIQVIEQEEDDVKIFNELSDDSFKEVWDTPENNHWDLFLKSNSNE